MNLILRGGITAHENMNVMVAMETVNENKGTEKNELHCVRWGNF